MSARRLVRALHHAATSAQAVQVLLAVAGIALLLHRLVLATVAFMLATALRLEGIRAARADADRDPADCPLCARAVRRAERKGAGR